MTTSTEKNGSATISHPRFSAFYKWFSNRRSTRRFTDPYRQELAEQAHGVVLEVGVGAGANFLFYKPEQIERLEAVEPDATMLAYAREQATQARIPITLSQASVEALPFADATFDSVVITLVLCSVQHPAKSMQEIHRVLKPGGSLLLCEHVRSEGPFNARLQDMMVPLTVRISGNCHWNRDTEQTVREAGFSPVDLRYLGRRALQPILILHAQRT